MRTASIVIAVLFGLQLASCRRPSPLELASQPASAPASQPAAPAAPRLPAPVRALWITRFDFKSEQDIAQIAANAAGAGFNTLFFQVRGNATALYRSSLEPWSELFGGADPGFDPLVVALREARAHGMQLHAWVNVMPAWWGTTPPADPEQVYNKRPEWMWYDQNGKRQPLVPTFYVSLNPCLPEVRDYLVAVFRDLLERYSVDGLHLDYLRFPNEPPVIPRGSGRDYPRDARTLELYKSDTGLKPQDGSQNWMEWRVAQVTKLARAIRAMQQEVRPACTLSAALAPDLEDSLLERFQDSRAWMSAGLFDLVVPMSYTPMLASYEKHIAEWKQLEGVSKLVMGFKLREGQPVDEARLRLERALAACDGYSFFAYQVLWDSTNQALVSQSETIQQARRVQRETWIPILQELAGREARSR